MIDRNTGAYSGRGANFQKQAYYPDYIVKCSPVSALARDPTSACVRRIGDATNMATKIKAPTSNLSLP